MGTMSADDLNSMSTEEKQSLVENRFISTKDGRNYYVSPAFRSVDGKFNDIFGDRAEEISTVLEKYTDRIVDPDIIHNKSMGTGSDQHAGDVELSDKTRDRVIQRLMELPGKPLEAYKADEVIKLFDAAASFLRTLHSGENYYYLSNDGTVNQLKYREIWGKLKESGLMKPDPANPGKYRMIDSFTGEEPAFKEIFGDDVEKAKKIAQELLVTRQYTAKDATFGMAPFNKGGDGEIQWERLFSDKSRLNAFQTMAFSYFGREGIEGKDIGLFTKDGKLTKKGLESWAQQVVAHDSVKITGAETIDVLKQGAKATFILTATAGEAEVAIRAMGSEFLQAERDAMLKDLRWKLAILSGTKPEGAISKYVSKFYGSGDVEGQPKMSWFNTIQFELLLKDHGEEGLKDLFRKAGFKGIIEILESENVKKRLPVIKEEVRAEFEGLVQAEIDKMVRPGEILDLASKAKIIGEAMELAKKKMVQRTVLTSVTVGADIQIGKDVVIDVKINGEDVLIKGEKPKAENLFGSIPQVYIGARSMSDIVQAIARFNPYDPNSTDPLVLKRHYESKRSIGDTTWVILPDHDWNLSDETKANLKNIEKHRNIVELAMQEGPTGLGAWINGEETKAIEKLLDGQGLNADQTNLIKNLIKNKMTGDSLKVNREALTTLLESREKVAAIADSFSAEKMHRGMEQITEQVAYISPEQIQQTHRVIEQARTEEAYQNRLANPELAPVAEPEQGTFLQFRAGDGYKQIARNAEELWSRYDLQGQQIIAGSTPLILATHQGAVKLESGDVWSQEDNMVYTPEEWAKPKTERVFKAAVAEMHVPIPSLGLGAPMEKRMVMVTVGKEGEQFVGKYEMPVMMPVMDAKGNITGMKPEKLEVKLIYNKNYNKFEWTHPDNGKVACRLGTVKAKG